MGAKEVKYAADRNLFKEGQQALSLFIITKGTVCIQKKKGAGYVELAKVYPNEVIGELAFFDRGVRNASAVTLTEVEAIEIDFISLDKIYRSTPAYFRTMIACLAERLRRADERLQRLQRGMFEAGLEPPEEEKPEERAPAFADAAAALAALDADAETGDKPDGEGT